MLSYHYTAKRKSDGEEISSDTIMDVGELGMGVMADKIKTALIRTHPMARSLTLDDIDIIMSFAKSSKSAG